MDIFTHWFLSYLINFGIHSLEYNEYAMVFGILIGILPDFDVLWYPVGKRIPTWRHRGASHSIFVISVETIILALIFGPIINVPVVVLILIGILTGLGHLCFDVLTTIGIPVFWPFSKRELHLDLERAINPYFMGLSIFFIIFLFQLRGRFYYPTYLIMINLITGCIILYYFIKLIIKLYIQTKYSNNEFLIKAIPTAGMFKWYLVGKKENNDTLKLKYCRYNLINKKPPKFKYFYCNCLKPTLLPLNSNEKAMAYSYHLAEVRSFINKFKYPLAEVTQRGPGSEWTVFWFPLELMGLNRAMAIKVDINSNGEYTAKHAYFKKYSNI